MNEPWLIRLLGGLSARQGEQRVARFRTRRAGALLAYLVFFSHRTHPREELAELFWPEANLEAGRNSLKQALSSLRRQLEPPGTPAGSILMADRQTVQINPSAVTSDVQQFEAAVRSAARAGDVTGKAQFLSQAVESYGGPLLPGMDDEWIWPERMRLAEAYERARHQLTQMQGPVSEPPTLSAQTRGPASQPLTPSLPLSFTRFFNRTEEITLLRAMLAPPGSTLDLSQPEARLVTLTGMGGTGKTRLAIEAARGLTEAFGGAVWFVPLADIPSAGLIVETIAETLRLPRSDTGEPFTQVVEALARQASLLILDNFEHVVEEGAQIVQRLLEQAPTLKCLITSRQTLEIAAEYEMVVSPLLTPQGHEAPERLARYASVQLFVDRAQRARPDFQITARNAEAVAALCEQLEGFPLALELAAANAAILTPRQMLEQLSRRVEFLVSQRRDLPERHRSLWAAMEWSYRLLPPQEQALFTQLSIFRGGWTLEAAKGMCDGGEILVGLQRLRGNSLLTTEERRDQIRYRMFETLRSFAEAQLSSEKKQAMAQRHAAYFLQWVSESPARFQGEEQAQWFDRLETEHANLRAALGWLLDTAAEMALTLAGRLWPFWEHRGHITEGRFWLTQALAASSARTPSRAEALRGAGILSDAQDDLTAALTQTQESVSLFRELDEWKGLAYSLAFCGYLHRETDLAQARAQLAESLAIFREKECQPGLIYALCYLGRLALREGRPAEANDFCRESLAISRRLSDPQGIAESLHLLANAALSQGDSAAAQPLLEECLALYRTLENRKGLAYALFSLGQIEYDRGEDSAAWALLEESREILWGIGHGPNLIRLLQLLEALARRRGDIPAALAYQKEALALRDRFQG